MRIAFMHPSESQLVRLVQGEVTGPRRATLNAHLAACHRCRDVVQGGRSVIAMVARSGTPRATDALLDRILEKRAEGARAILPELDETSRDEKGRGRSRALMGMAAAASLAVLGGTATMRRDSAPEYVRSNAGRVAESRTGDSGAAAGFGLDIAGDMALDMATAFSPVPRAIGAQAKPANLPRILPPPIAGIDGAKLRAGGWSYVETFRDNAGRSRPNSATHVTVTPVTFRDRPALRLAKRYVINSEVTDTLILDLADLRPLHRRLHVGRYTVTSEFSTDGSGDVLLVRSLAPTDSSQPPKVDSAHLFVSPTGVVLVHENQLDLLFRVTRLHRDWRATVGKSGPRGKDGVARPGAMTLAVVGEETVEYPMAPSREAWRVRIVETSTGGMPRPTVYLVSKSTGEILRAVTPAWTYTPKGDPDGKYVTELVTR